MMLFNEEPSRHRVTLFYSNRRHGMGFFQVWAVMAGNVIRARELIWQLFKRDFAAQYKKSFIGMAWLLIAPLMGIVSWVFLQRTGMLNPGDVGIPYAAYVLLGTSMWGLFIGTFASASQTLTSGSALIMQVNYPHEVLLFKETAQYLATFLITLLVNVAVMLWFHVVPSWGILFLPVVALPLVLLAAGIGLVVSMITIVVTDLSRLVNISLGFLMYLTPVIYAEGTLGPRMQKVIHWNPLTHLVCSARDVVIYGRLYDTWGYIASSALAVIVFLVSWRLFYAAEDKLAERMV